MVYISITIVLWLTWFTIICHVVNFFASTCLLYFQILMQQSDLNDMVEKHKSINSDESEQIVMDSKESLNTLNLRKDTLMKEVNHIEKEISEKEKQIKKA